LQALDLTNGQDFAAVLERGVKQLRENAADGSPDNLIDGLYRAALARDPTEAERATARELLGKPMTDD